jgi:hypothetical protein
MRRYLAVDRFWGQLPGWLASLPVEQQAELLADYELELEARREMDVQR